MQQQINAIRIELKKKEESGRCEKRKRYKIMQECIEHIQELSTKLLDLASA